MADLRPRNLCRTLISPVARAEGLNTSSSSVARNRPRSENRQQGEGLIGAIATEASPVSLSLMVLLIERMKTVGFRS